MQMKPIIETEKFDGGVAWTSPDGERHVYSIGSRTLMLEVQELSLVQHTEPYGDTNVAKPLRNAFKGKAILVRDSVEIIGKSESRSRNVSIWFREFNEEFATRLSAERREEAPKIFQPASIWCGGGKDDWEITIQLSPDQIQALIDTYRSAQIYKVSAALSSLKYYLKGKFTYDYNEELFIPPNNNGGCHIWASLEAFSVTSTLMNLHQVSPVEEPIQANKIEVANIPIIEDKPLPNVEILSGKLENISSLLKIIIAALFVAICSLIIK